MTPASYGFSCVERWGLSLGGKGEGERSTAREIIIEFTPLGALFQRLRVWKGALYGGLLIAVPALDDDLEVVAVGEGGEFAGHFAALPGVFPAFEADARASGEGAALDCGGWNNGGSGLALGGLTE